jgi:hypothetical protein
MEWGLGDATLISLPISTPDRRQPEGSPRSDPCESVGAEGLSDLGYGAEEGNRRCAAITQGLEPSGRGSSLKPSIASCNGGGATPSDLRPGVLSRSDCLVTSLVCRTNPQRIGRPPVTAIRAPEI